MVDLVNSLHIAASGMKVQSERLRIIAQNVANADATADTPGGDPYRRRILTFRNYFDRELGIERVRVHKFGEDPSQFPLKFDPYHPAADENGYVKLPNVKSMIEMTDMREAQRSYEANMQVITVSKGMLMQTIGLLRN